MKLWDVRTIKSLVTLDFGPYSANSVSFHPAGTRIFSKKIFPNKEKFFSFQGQLLTAASSDRTIKLYNIGSEQVTYRSIRLIITSILSHFHSQLVPLSSHHDEVQYVKFDLKGQYMVSTGRDRTLRVWS